MSNLFFLIILFTSATTTAATKYAIINCQSHVDAGLGSYPIFAGRASFDDSSLIFRNDGFTITLRAVTVSHNKIDNKECEYTDYRICNSSDLGKIFCGEVRDWNSLTLVWENKITFLNCGANSTLSVYDADKSEFVNEAEAAYIGGEYYSEFGDSNKSVLLPYPGKVARKACLTNNL